MPTPPEPGTTRAGRQRARLIVHTGQGKGKSTAAFGLALRGWAQGWSVAVYQFVKSDKWPAGERAAFAALTALPPEQGGRGEVHWHTMGAGWTWLRATQSLDQAELARAGWEQVADDLAAARHRLYVLDEFTYAMARGWVPTEQVVAALRDRPGTQHVVITGRDCPAAVIDIADIVTEMTKIAHPFDRGERGQAGIEW